MLETQGHIIEVDQDHAWVETRRAVGCGHCDTTRGCATGTLSQLFGARRMARVRALNPGGRRVGDQVTLVIPDGSLLRSATAVYVIPIAMVLFFAALGSWLGNTHARADLFAAIGAALGMAAGYFWLRFYQARVVRDRRFQPVIKEQDDGDQTKIIHFMGK